MNRVPYIFIATFFTLTFWGPSLPGFNLYSIHFFPARIALLLAWIGLFLLLLDSKNRGQALNALKTNPWTIPAVIWIIISLILISVAENTSLAIQHFFHLFLGLSILTLAPLLPRKILHTIWVVNAIIIIFLGFLSLLTALDSSIHPHHQNWLTIVFGNENNFAMFICLSIPFLATQTKPFLRSISLLAIPIGVAIILATTARLSYITVAILAFVLPILFIRAALSNRKKLIPILLTTFVMLLLTSAILTQSEKVNNQISSVLLTLNSIRNPESIVDASISVRINITLDGLIMTRRAKYLGVGPGNFEHHMEQYAVHQTAPPINPHNWWVELLAEYGLPIFLLYLGVFIYLLIRHIRERDSKENIAIMAALIIFPILAMAPSRMIWCSPHWLLLATAAAKEKTYN